MVIIELVINKDFHKETSNSEELIDFELDKGIVIREANLASSSK